MSISYAYLWFWDVKSTWRTSGFCNPHVTPSYCGPFHDTSDRIFVSVTQANLSQAVCVHEWACVCVCEKEREGEGGRKWGREKWSIGCAMQGWSEFHDCDPVKGTILPWSVGWLGDPTGLLAVSEFWSVFSDETRPLWCWSNYPREYLAGLRILGDGLVCWWLFF